MMGMKNDAVFILLVKHLFHEPQCTVFMHGKEGIPSKTDHFAV
jgi:hypothetical protein